MWVNPLVGSPGMSLRRRVGASVMAAVCAASVVPARTASAADYEVVTAVVSAAPGFANANGAVGSVRLASGGRFVAFTSKATNLVPGTTAGIERVYVRDLLTDATTLVSRTGGGTPNEVEPAYLGAISPNGEFVVFSTVQPMVAADTNGLGDVYLWKRSTNTIELVSVTSSETQGNGHSGTVNGDYKADVSNDGRYVFFSSLATNMNFSADANGVADIFRRDRVLGNTSLISVNGASQTNGASFQVDASGDGRYVVFGTTATNFPGTDTNGASDIWFRDINDLTLSKISLGLDADANGSSLFPTISDDGNRVMFQSTSSDLVNSDTNASFDVFYRQRSTGATFRLSTNAGYQQLPTGAISAGMTPDGQRFAFVTTSSALATDTNGVADVYLRESGANTLASVRSDGSLSTAAAFGGSVADDTVAWVSTDRSAPTDTNSLADSFVRVTPFLGTFTSFDTFVPFQIGRITGTTPSAAQTANARKLLRSGASPERWVMDQLDAPSFSDKRAPVIRLYWAYFKRRPDLGGLNFWMNRFRNGTRLVDISQQFSRSSEFQAKYGNTTPEQFVTLVYQNVLERNPDAAGLTHWAKKIRSGTPRGQVMTNFSESSEGQRKIGPRSDTILAALGMYGKIPSAALFDAIVSDRLAGFPREVTIDYLLGAPEYIATLP